MPTHAKKSAYSVTMLIPRDRFEMGDPLNRIMVEVSRMLDGTAQLNVQTSRAIKMNRPGRHLGRLTDSAPSDCWVLVQSSPATQRWFAQQGLPCVIVGSVAEGVNFSSVDIEWKTTGAHMANLLARYGHRKVLVVERHIQAMGSILLKDGYSERFDALGVRCLNVHPEHGVVSLLEKYFAEEFREKRQFSVLVFYEQEDLVTGMTWLLAHGWQIPDDVSVLCLDAASDISRLYPAVSHYHRRVRPISKAIAKLVVQTVQGLMVKAEHRYLQEFVQLDTLGNCNDDPE